MEIHENTRKLSEQLKDKLPDVSDGQLAAIITETQDEAIAEAKAGKEGYGYYVYGIVGGNGSQPVQGLPEAGMDPAYLVYALSYHGIQAIVSIVPLREFGQQELKANLNDIKWLEAKVCAHQRILETMLARYTLIPVKFCTIYRSERRVQEMLAAYYDDFVNTLGRLRGKQEWGVKLYCDGEALAQRIGEVSDKVKQLQAEMAKESIGAAYFMKKKMEQTIDEEKERVSDECAQCSHNRLSSYAEETVISPLQSKQVTGRPEDMILNGAYLVADQKLTDFQAELESLQYEYGTLGFSYEMTGPWPLYNFVTIGAEEGAGDE